MRVPNIFPLYMPYCILPVLYVGSSNFPRTSFIMFYSMFDRTGGTVERDDSYRLI